MGHPHQEVIRTMSKLSMSRWIAGGLLAAAVLTAGAFAFRITPAGAATTPNDDRILSISGEARARVKPDTAEARIGVRTEAPTAREAMKRNADTVAAVTARLKQAGVKEEEMGTENWNVHPIFNHKPEGRAPEVTGYAAQLTIVVRTAKVDTVGDLIDQAFQSGANVAEGIRFFTQNTSAIEDKLLEDAVKAARAKADLLARASGVRIVGVKRVTANGPILFDNKIGFGGDRLAAGESAAFLPPGQSEISRSVHVEYLIDD